MSEGMIVGAHQGSGEEPPVVDRQEEEDLQAVVGTRMTTERMGATEVDQKATKRKEQGIGVSSVGARIILPVTPTARKLRNIVTCVTL